eukprot:1949454-Rhodomonas_salina.1
MCDVACASSGEILPPPPSARYLVPATDVAHVGARGSVAEFGGLRGVWGYVSSSDAESGGASGKCCW